MKTANPKTKPATDTPTETTNVAPQPELPVTQQLSPQAQLLRRRVAETLTAGEFVAQITDLLTEFLPRARTDWMTRLRTRQVFSGLDTTLAPDAFLREAIATAVEIGLEPTSTESEQRSIRDVVKEVCNLTDSAARPQTILAMADRNRATPAQIIAFRCMLPIWKLRKDFKAAAAPAQIPLVTLENLF